MGGNRHRLAELLGARTGFSTQSPGFVEMTKHRLQDTAGDDLTGIDPDPGDDPHAVIALELVVHDRESLAHLGSRTHSPERVVLVQHGNATASPMNFSSVPPCRSTASRIAPK